MLMNTTFLGDSFSIKWQSRVLTQKFIIIIAQKRKKSIIFANKIEKAGVYHSRMPSC